MLEKEIIGKEASQMQPKQRKAYETPELKQLGSFEELTRWEASVGVGGQP